MLLPWGRRRQGEAQAEARPDARAVKARNPLRSSAACRGQDYAQIPHDRTRTRLSCALISLPSVRERIGKYVQLLSISLMRRGGCIRKLLSDHIGHPATSLQWKTTSTCLCILLRICFRFILLQMVGRVCSWPDQRMWGGERCQDEACVCGNGRRQAV